MTTLKGTDTPDSSVEDKEKEVNEIHTSEETDDNAGDSVGEEKDEKEVEVVEEKK